MKSEKRDGKGFAILKAEIWLGGGPQLLARNFVRFGGFQQSSGSYVIMSCLLA